MRVYTYLSLRWALYYAVLGYTLLIYAYNLAISFFNYYLMVNENKTPEISLTVLKTFKEFVYSFTKSIACDHE